MIRLEIGIGAKEACNAKKVRNQMESAFSIEIFDTADVQKYFDVISFFFFNLVLLFSHHNLTI